MSAIANRLRRIKPKAIVPTYYVDATNGSDTNNGLTPATALKSMETINAATLSPGDVVAFKRGETWRTPLLPSSSGTAANPITFTAYGEGQKPVISGAGIFPAGSWTNLYGDIWATTLASIPEFVRFNGVDGTRVTLPAMPESAGDWVLDENDGTFAVYSVGNPATFFASPGVEISYWYILIDANEQSHLVFDNLAVTDSKGVAAIYVDGASTNIKVENCLVVNNVGSGIKLDGNTGGGHLIKSCEVYNSGTFGIELYHCDTTAGNENVVRLCNSYSNVKDGIYSESNYTIIEHNRTHGNGKTGEAVSGIRVLDLIDGNGTWGDYNIIRYNTSYDNQGLHTDGHGILLDHYSDHCEIYYNVCYNNWGMGVGVFKAKNANVYNNVAYGNGQCPNNGGPLIKADIGLVDDDEVDRIENVNVKNNISIATKTGQYAVMISGPIGDNVGIDISNNIWLSTTGDFYNAQGATGNNVATWNALPYVGTDILADPLFVDALNRDFQLQDGSPAINTGASVGLKLDHAGRVVADPPDIGAYEKL